MSDDKKSRIVIDLNDTFHPYENENLREEQPEPPIANKREPFNDYVKHQDIIVGHQRNRTLSDYPRTVRPWARIYAILSLGIIVGSILISVYQAMR